MNTQYLILDDTLTDIASAIRQKTGDSATLPVSEFADKILTIGNYQQGYNAGYSVGYTDGFNSASRTLDYTWDENSLTLTINEVSQ